MKYVYAGAAKCIEGHEEIPFQRAKVENRNLADRRNAFKVSFKR